jgi:hypothetical protein
MLGYSEQTLNLFKKYGNRTSSLLSLYPHFKSYQQQKYEIRYIEKKNLVAIANEPLAPESIRKEAVVEYFSEAQNQKKDQLIFPISERLAAELKDESFNVWQVGAEPIFTLNKYFKEGEDKLSQFPIARTLKSRGGKVSEITLEQFIERKDEINELREEWLAGKKNSAFEFLNIVDPLEQKEYKRFFILEFKGKLMAFMTATPVYLNNQIIGYFFNDILRRQKVKSATNELLIIDSMKILHDEGILEVRLGLAPLARLEKDCRDYKTLNSIFEKWHFGYNFKTLYQFKNKLGPTKWRPIYLASNRKTLSSVLINVLRLHLTPGAFKEFVKRSWYSYRRNMEMKENLKSIKKPKTKPLTVLTFLSRIKYTLALHVFFMGLHYLKNNSEPVLALFNSSAYIPGKVTAAGLFIGPLFHNHLYHLMGDQLSFVIFAGIIEYTFGPMFMLMITAIGLWLSNPFTKAFLASTLRVFSPESFQQMLLEKDYGSSNAVFALAGAYLFTLKTKGWLFWPFFFHALYICFQRESYLAIHHFMGIYLGYVFAVIYLKSRILKAKSQIR